MTIELTTTNLYLLISLKCLLWLCNIFGTYLVKLIVCFDIVNITFLAYYVVFLIVRYFQLVIYWKSYILRKIYIWYTRNLDSVFDSFDKKPRFLVFDSCHQNLEDHPQNAVDCA